jgi:hypothetical protein
VWRYAGSLDVRCVRTCVCNAAAVQAAEELHARSKGYLTSVVTLASVGQREGGREREGERERAGGEREGWRGESGEGGGG